MLPLSQQSLANDFVAVRETPLQGRACELQVSEESSVGVVFSRGRKIVKKYAVEMGTGTRPLTAKGLRLIVR